MKLSLTTWQRITLFNLLGVVSGVDLATINKGGKVLDALEMTEAENKKVNVHNLTVAYPKPCPKCGTEVSLDVESGQITWEKPEHRWEIEIADRNAADYLKVFILENKSWRMADHKQVDDLKAQIEKA